MRFLAALALAGALAALLGACAQVQSDVASDAASAAAIATAAGRTQDVPCFTAIGALATAAKGLQPPAILSTAELGLAGQALAQGPCSAIIGDIALSVIQHTPVIVPVAP
jgi:hypothetical protein